MWTITALVFSHIWDEDGAQRDERMSHNNEMRLRYSSSNQTTKPLKDYIDDTKRRNIVTELLFAAPNTLQR